MASQAKRQINGVSNQVSSAASSAGAAVPKTSAYEILMSRIGSRLGEMAENMSIVEKTNPNAHLAGAGAGAASAAANGDAGPKRPRKLDIRLGGQGADNVSFSAPFLDNTLSKMLALQNRMLKVGSELAKAEGVPDRVKHEQFAQSAELSRIIALICAEKARQGA